MTIMRINSPFVRTIAMTILVCFTASCASPHFPKEFAKPSQAYETGPSSESLSDIPKASYKTAVFNAPYEDVFQSVYTGATQAQINIEVSDKKSGLILGEIDDHGVPPGWVAPQQRERFFKILLKETGPKTTTVTALSKVQWECHTSPPGDYIFWGALSFTVAPLLFLVAMNEDDKHCKEELSVVHWDGDSAEILNQVMTFSRNNLVAAGVL